MKKKLILLMLALSLTVTAAGCKSKAKDQGETTEKGNTDKSKDKSATVETNEEGKTVVKFKDGTVTLGDYKGIEVPVYEVNIDETAIDNLVKSSLAGKSEEVTDGEAILGDIVTIDFVGSIDGVEFEGGTSKDYSIELGSGDFIPGFEDQMIGMKAGENKDINVTFPEDYGSAEYAGKEAVFAVTMNKISRAPELTEDNVKELTDFDSIKEYRDDLTEKYTMQQEYSNRMQRENIAWSTVAANAVVDDVSEDRVKEAVPVIIESMERQAQNYGLDYDTFMAQMVGLTEEEDIDQFNQEQAQMYVEQRLTIDAIIKAEELELTEDEYKAGCEIYVERFGLKDQAELEESLGEDTLRERVQTDKVFDFIFDHSVTPKETEAETAQLSEESQDATE
ncbi:MAG TPA: trigger factor [Candidatus Merdenecus merdavium]|nr:trigger factor [Candidatus Merdenecus merdavium]